MHSPCLSCGSATTNKNPPRRLIARASVPPSMALGSGGTQGNVERKNGRIAGSTTGAGPDQPPVGTVRGDAAGRSRRRRDQDRAAGIGRCCARHAAVRERGERAVHDLEPQQAIRRARFQAARGQGGVPGAGRPRRHPDRELSSGRDGAARARLGRAACAQQAADLRRHLRLRPDRPLCRARRLRPDDAGHVRTDEHQRPRGRTAAPAADRHFRRRRRHVPGLRVGRGAGGAASHRRGPVRRNLVAGKRDLARRV